MSQQKFKDTNGRVFEASVVRESGFGVDAVYMLEDAGYLDGEQEEVPEDELRAVEDRDYMDINAAALDARYNEDGQDR